MKMVKGFRDSIILTEKGIIKTNILIDNGIITKIGDFEVDGLIKLDDDKIVIPGFIDEHIHGSFNSDVLDGDIDALKNMANSLLSEGTTAFLATTSTVSKEILENSLKNVCEYMSKYNDSSIVLGVHLEGPFISNKYLGAQMGEFVEKPSVNLFKHYNSLSGNNIKLISYAPEEDVDYTFTKYLKESLITASIGHSAASYQEVVKAINNGLTCSTHTYNAQKGIHHREVGVVGASMLEDELYTELICDGIHVSYPAVRLLVKNKPLDKIVLITDSLRVKHLDDGKYTEPSGQVIIKDGGVARLEDGTIAGSILKMNEAVKNILDNTNVSFIDAVNFASANPAKNLRMFDKMGSISVGKLANLLVVDKDINIYKTIVKGKILYEKSED